MYTSAKRVTYPLSEDKALDKYHSYDPYEKVCIGVDIFLPSFSFEVEGEEVKELEMFNG